MAARPDQSNTGGFKVVPKFLGGKTNRPSVWSIATFLVGAVTLAGLFASWLNPVPIEHVRPHVEVAPAQVTDSTSVSHRPQSLNKLELVSLDPSRAVDATDVFADYTQTDNCTLSSLDLHIPFSPLCPDKTSLLAAMSGGGRAGFDQPYRPLGCDMRWYTADEICGILDRFEEVVLLGDSQVRGLAVAFQVMLRMDLYDGGRPSWRGNSFKPSMCHCKDVYMPRCKYYCNASSRETRKHDRASLYCDRREGVVQAAADVQFMELGAVPLPQREYNHVVNERPKTKPSRPIAWVFGNGLRNNLNFELSQEWVNRLMQNVLRLPYYQSDTAYMPRLFITPNAAGVNKPVMFAGSQGNVKLQRFEASMRKWVRTQGFDHLGTWNLTVQTTMPDGTHAGMMGDLTKAMMVLNWLDHLDTSQWNTSQIVV